MFRNYCVQPGSIQKSSENLFNRAVAPFTLIPFRVGGYVAGVDGKRTKNVYKEASVNFI